jgi:hypothetical protein
MGFTVTAKYELEFTFKVPEGIDLNDPSVSCGTGWDDFDNNHYPWLYISFDDDRESICIDGELDACYEMGYCEAEDDEDNDSSKDDSSSEEHDE